MSWRPKDYPENPCNDCPRKREDEYGLLCALGCGEGNAWANQDNGAELMFNAMQDFYNKWNFLPTEGNDGED